MLMLIDMETGSLTKLTEDLVEILKANPVLWDAIERQRERVRK
jgi:hypothetical protein